jgi:serine/threonine protein kinase
VHEEEADPLDSGAGEDGEFYQMEGPVNWSKGKLIGAGAFGRVFQGLNNDTGQILAVKQVNLTKVSTLSCKPQPLAEVTEVPLLH